jgi:hypothetical protein
MLLNLGITIDKVMLDSKVLEQFYPSVWVDIALAVRRQRGDTLPVC